VKAITYSKKSKDTANLKRRHPAWSLSWSAT